MKKIFIFAVAVMLATVSANAQSDEPRHEVGVSYGLGASAIIDALGNDVFDGIFDHLEGYESKDTKNFGTLAVEYFYRLNNPRMAVGGILTYAKYGEDVVKKNGGDKYGERNRNYLSVIPSVKYDWVHKSNFAIYTKLGAGIMTLSDKRETHETNKSETENTTYFIYQASLLGMEAGSRNLRAFFELGVGEQGIILAGLKYKF